MLYFEILNMATANCKLNCQYVSIVYSIIFNIYVGFIFIVRQYVSKK